MLTKSDMALDANSRLKPATQGIFKFWSLIRSLGSGTASFFGRKQRRARKASDFHRERDVWERSRDRRGRDLDGTRQGLMRLLAPAKQTEKNYNSQPENFCILIHGQSETKISSGGKIKAS